MPNGRNAGRLFADCEGEHGYGQSHSIPKDVAEGEEVECRHCHRKFKIVDGHLEPLPMEIEESDHDYRAELLHFPKRIIVRTHAQVPIGISKAGKGVPSSERYRTVPQDKLYVPAELLERFVGHEDAPCSFDHHGYCQEHPGEQQPHDCPVSKARALLYDKAHD